jgi:hypothetical protein
MACFVFEAHMPITYIGSCALEANVHVLTYWHSYLREFDTQMIDKAYTKTCLQCVSEYQSRMGMCRVQKYSKRIRHENLQCSIHILIVHL